MPSMFIQDKALTGNSVLRRYTENLWDGITKNPELMKGFISETVVNLWEIVYTGLGVRTHINVVAN